MIKKMMLARINARWLKQKYHKEMLSCQEIAKLLITPVSRQTIYLKLKQFGINPRSKQDSIFYVDGERCKISQGYFWIWNPLHPRTNGSYVKRSVLNLEKKLGRFLKDGEFPHHIDNNRMNDAPENLELTDRANHARHHRIGYRKHIPRLDRR